MSNVKQKLTLYTKSVEKNRIGQFVFLRTGLIAKTGFILSKVIRF